VIAPHADVVGSLLRPPGLLTAQQELAAGTLSPAEFKKGLWANFWSAEHSKPAYPTLDSFLFDIVQILREEIGELVRLGARYIQLDGPHYGLLLDPKTRRFYEDQGWSLDQWLGKGIELDNAVMDPFPGVTFGLHV
jgi:5-methyltetrahydropteroyltriglutamate--homocysteine methyltransferase